MPSVAVSDKWFVRCDGEWDFLKERIKLVLQWVDLTHIIAALHSGRSGEKPHFHAVIKLSSSLQKQSFDVRLKKIFGVSGNKKGSGYSTVVWDGNDKEYGCGTYLFHEEGAPLLASKGYTEQEIQELQRIADNVRPAVEAAKKKAECRIPIQILEEIEASGGIWSKYQILQRIIWGAKNGDWYLPKGYNIKGYVEETYLRQLKDADDVERYIADIYNAIYVK